LKKILDKKVYKGTSDDKIELDRIPPPSGSNIVKEGQNKTAEKTELIRIPQEDSDNDMIKKVDQNKKVEKIDLVRIPQTNDSDNTTNLLSARVGMVTGDTTYKGLVNFIKARNDFDPTSKSVSDHVMGLQAECPEISSILADCRKFVGSLPTNLHNLTENERMAVALYTWDVRLNGGSSEDNFYYKLNKMLQERTISKLEQWGGYLYYFQSALAKIPCVPEGTRLYRGINTAATTGNYGLGRQIHWSAYSSASLEQDSAKAFATKGGVVMVIQVCKEGGKNISDYSPFTTEKEILLSPNIEMIVSKALHVAEDGHSYIELTQKDSGVNTYVF